MSLDVHRHFHDELSHVKVRLLTMSGEAEAALGLAVEALLERDPGKAQRVIQGDRVQCGVSPYDPTHGFITYREPPGGAPRPEGAPGAKS